MYNKLDVWDHFPLLCILGKLIITRKLSCTLFFFEKVVKWCFKTKATEITAYFEETDNTDCNGEWKGNHTFVNSVRNKMTHRNSPNVAVMSDYDTNLKQHPVFLIKRILEDYIVATKYIKEILDKIEKEVMVSIEV